MTPPTCDLADSMAFTEMESDWAPAHVTFGPSVFESRRQLWVSGRPLDGGVPASAFTTPGLGSSIGRNRSRGRENRTKRSNPSAEALKRLDDVLASPDVDTDDEIWWSYLSDVHRRLIGGNRLKRGLKLSQAVSLLTTVRLFVPYASPPHWMIF